ncbi:hypothetical protein RMR21_021595 [Agrobacterium sp. rho-8.1]|nr:hypothetical protein [Agrobacterium sp. rho-8.1]
MSAHSAAFARRERPVVQSARAVGVKDWHITFQHPWPNPIGSVILVEPQGAKNDDRDLQPAL